MMIKRRLFLSYIALGLVLIFFVYSLNTIYVDRYELDTEASDLSADVTPPDPFPQGKPDFRKKKQEEEEERKHQEEERKRKAAEKEEKERKLKEEQEKAKKEEAKKESNSKTSIPNTDKQDKTEEQKKVSQ